MKIFCRKQSASLTPVDKVEAAMIFKTLKNELATSNRITEVKFIKSDGWAILFEFTVPRVGKRVDVVIVTNRAVFVLEFKVNADEYLSADKDQARLALDLKNFHETSHDTLIVPILIATAAENKPPLMSFLMMAFVN